MFIVIVEEFDKPKEYWGPFTSAEVEGFMADRGLLQITSDDYRHWRNDTEKMSAVVRALIKSE